MADYREMYRQLFAEVTRAVAILQDAQKKAEELYLAQEEAPVVLEKKKTKTKRF